MTTDQLYQDRELFRRIALGDEDAFRVLFHAYNKMLLPFVVKLVSGLHDPAEILQEVFLRLWKHRGKLADVENPKAYIVRIVSNEATTYMQKLARQNRLMEKAIRQRSQDPLTPEEQIALKETARLVTNAVELLSPACRQVYILSREEQLSLPQIAEKLQLSESTVKNQLVKALKDIRLYIRKNGLSTFLSFPIIF
ncbi:RNA polymerase sigma factor [Pseudobacter ginsenosidimutans]|uniref:RNA polymerase sigma-70 factor (ECF subfamily) n=1 Tax=Pseudobacter ginsenosidimutans TaxID=661488 RepID=A0A4Q7MQY2_9BACT|nr:RNA polymerase sigma-70 factor [Pseudobacter ginsenosidimutans]QEC42029.1 RNA polymerase sigma-70 factor [Pseudobacter ginsenosidimutans]RZS71135.1 RNA polymerase sigma-70 factor (ECF subfamily) [Pseudobacter ginsenosidimutans]